MYLLIWAICLITEGKVLYAPMIDFVFWSSTTSLLWKTYT